jgi:SAM-dependent methyltransferase
MLFFVERMMLVWYNTAMPNSAFQQPGYADLHSAFLASENKVENLERQLQASKARGYTPIISNSNPLPIESETATKIIAMEMLEHVDDPEAILKELVRVGKPGAQYLISVPAPKGEYVQKECAPAVHFEPPNHIHIFEHQQFEDMLVNAGLVIEERNSAGFFWVVWLCMYWAAMKAKGDIKPGATLDKIEPPYDPMLQHWAIAWHMLLQNPHGIEAKKALDEILHKSHAIIARKPDHLNNYEK